MKSTLVVVALLAFACSEKAVDTKLPPPIVSTGTVTEVGDNDGNGNTTAVVITGTVSGYSLGHGICINTIPITCTDLCSTVCSLETLSREPKDSVLSFEVLWEGLTPATTYYAIAHAYNSSGIDNGSQIVFNTDSIRDVDGNGYATVLIGDQVWLKKNLKTSKYNNGDAIDTPAADWGIATTTTGGWCYYNDDPAMNTDYGKLYNWFAVTDPRKLCPSGWHVASDAEWTEMESYLGGATVAGGKLKEAGLAHWNAPNSGATNSSGFTGLPGGNRRGADNSIYETLGVMGRFWTSTEVSSEAALGRDLVFDGAHVGNGLTNQFNKKYGFSVRCTMTK